MHIVYNYMNEDRTNHNGFYLLILTFFFFENVDSDCQRVEQRTKQAQNNTHPSNYQDRSL
jgi:hypothetical protein